MHSFCRGHLQTPYKKGQSGLGFRGRLANRRLWQARSLGSGWNGDLNGLQKRRPKLDKLNPYLSPGSIHRGHKPATPKQNSGAHHPKVPYPNTLNPKPETPNTRLLRRLSATSKPAAERSERQNRASSGFVRCFCVAFAFQGGRFRGRREQGLGIRVFRGRGGAVWFGARGLSDCFDFWLHTRYCMGCVGKLGLLPTFPSIRADASHSSTEPYCSGASRSLRS